MYGRLKTAMCSATKQQVQDCQSLSSKATRSTKSVIVLNPSY